MTTVQHPYHHFHPCQYHHHPRLVSLQTWQGSHHLLLLLRVSQTYPFLRHFRGSLHRCRHHHQVLLEARPAAPSHPRLQVSLLLPLASGRLQEGTLRHLRGYSAVCPLRLQASSRDTAPRLSHKTPDLVLPRTLRHHRYLLTHPLLSRRRQRCLQRHSCVTSRRRAPHSFLLRSTANARMPEGS